MKPKKVFNVIAMGSFPVLLIHDHNVFRDVIWSLIFRTQEWYYSEWFFGRLLLVAILVYTIGFALEVVRKILLEKPLFSVNIITRICTKIDNKLN